jgi:hypothetical protein
MSKLQELGDTGDRMMQGLPYGQGGAVTGASSFDTFSSPDVSQDPNKFGTLTDKSKITATDKQSMQKIAPFGPYTGQDPKSFDADVAQIKYKVTPDEVLTGIDYEMKKMVLKDKHVAKQNVVSNLKKDPQYYSKLRMIIIEDEDGGKNQTDYRTPQEKAIAEIMRDLAKKKHEKRYPTT